MTQSIERNKKTNEPGANIILRDYLAIDRTRLANQRTLLSFLRTGLYLFITALAVIKVEPLQKLKFLGGIFIAMSIITIVIGVVNYIRMKKKIQKHYTDPPSSGDDAL